VVAVHTNDSAANGLTCRMSADLRAELESIATQEERTVSAVIRRLLSEGVRRRRKRTVVGREGTDGAARLGS
jgi:hypothetical protein